MPTEVNKDVCIGCASCVGVCPVEALKIGDDGKAESDPDKCIDCGACVAACPVSAITQK